jgi:hypothetical protein
MQWLSVKITVEEVLIDFPIPVLALDVHLAGIPGAPGAIKPCSAITLLFIG